MTSLTLEATDRESGERFFLTVYERNGRLVFQRLGEHLFRDGLTPSRLDTMARFGAAAFRARGSQMEGELPPAAERVRDGFIGYVKTTAAPKRRRSRTSHEEYYRRVLGSETIEWLEALFNSRGVAAENRR